MYMFDHAFKEHEKSSKRGKAFSCTHYSPPILTEDDSCGSPDLAHLNFSHFDSIHEHGHDEPHCSSHHIRHRCFTYAIAFHRSGNSFIIIMGYCRG